MKCNFMCRIIFLLLIFISNNTQPVYAQTQSVQIKTNLAFFSEKFLDVKNGFRYSDKGISELNIKSNTANSVSQLALNYDGYNNFTFDRSYLQYTKGIITYGVGKVDRNWSFSDHTSLILSNNARPSDSIYLKLENKFGYKWLPSNANWSFEAFNGFTEGSLNGSTSMLLGMRAILSPVVGLDFELVQTSQWGGKGYSRGISALKSTLAFDTNTSSNSNINKMAGFGISYTAPSKIIPLRIYGQAVGEDEAGNLPSCFAYLAGLEWKNTKIKYPTIVVIEAVDTRIDTTKAGNCGSNTMYNNNIYDYTNYGRTMGAEIDSEGTSLGLYLKSQISQEINIEYAIKSVIINDNNWSGHRLSSKRESGLINSIGISWAKSNFILMGNIYNQGLSLNKADINNGNGIGFTSSIEF